jgi:outer membrane protein TolC
MNKPGRSARSIGGSVLAPLFAGERLRAGTQVAAAQRDHAAESDCRIARSPLFARSPTR